MYNMPNQHSLLLVKWLGTTLCLVGIALTSFNLYPANIIFSLIGSILWTIAGILQHDAPLVLVEGVAVLLYTVGFISYVVSKLHYYF